MKGRCPTCCKRLYKESLRAMQCDFAHRWENTRQRRILDMNYIRDIREEADRQPSGWEEST